MRSQLDIFGGADGTRKSAAALPEGFLYKPELISSADETALMARVRELPFRDFEFHGYTGKRRTVSFGGSVAKNILATISCAAEYALASICWVVRTFLQHYRLNCLYNLKAGRNYK